MCCEHWTPTFISTNYVLCFRFVYILRDRNYFTYFSLAASCRPHPFIIWHRKEKRNGEREKTVVSSWAPFYRVSLIFKKQVNNAAKNISEEKWKRYTFHSPGPHNSSIPFIRQHNRNDIHNASYTLHNSTSFKLRWILSTFFCCWIFYKKKFTNCLLWNFYPSSRGRSSVQNYRVVCKCLPNSVAADAFSFSNRNTY